MGPSQDNPTLILALVSGVEERELLQALVLTLGASLIWCSQADQILRMIETNNPTVVVLDFGDLKPKGSSILRKVLQARPSMPTLVLVDEHARQDALDAHRNGVFAVIRKPVREDEFQFHLGHALATFAEIYDPSRVRREERNLVIHNDFTLITSVAKSLVETTLSPADPRRTQVTLGLIEILSNAIEHGNLGIDFQAKREALRGSFFFDLAQERSKTKPWSDRLVRITSQVLPSEGVVRFIVADEGDGFDWRSPPDPNDPENMVARHGRGLLMARHSFDKISFNERGNVVTLEAAILPMPSLESR